LAGSQFNQFAQLFRPASCSSIQARGCKLTELIVDISGQYIEAKETGHVTCAYGAYEIKIHGGKTATEAIVKHTTFYASTVTG
jgi:hypothetical protein